VENEKDAMRLRPSLCLVLIVAALAATMPGSRHDPAGAQTPAAFASRIAALSEHGGYFDTDNLISNERSYLDVLPELERRGLRGGAYVGVGPDQNFSYIAAVRPSIAVIIDVRRDNLLLHLLFKALFALAPTRVEYLALLLGRPVPADPAAWKDARIDRLVGYASAAALPPGQIASLRARVDATVRKCGVPLSRDDLATIDRFHRRFIEAGLSLRFQSTGRPPQSHYPTYRDLLLETDTAGRQGNYLASEAAYQFIRQLQARDLIIPVTGDLAGPSAMAAIGRLLDERRETLSALYASNVEFYLFGDGRFPSFVGNLGRLRHTDRTVIIRSIFNRYSLTGARRGSASASVVQPVRELIEGFAAGRYRRYHELIGQP
jgi:hypothetical protein